MILIERGPIREKMPTPPSIMVGLKPGQTKADIDMALKELEESDADR